MPLMSDGRPNGAAVRRQLGLDGPVAAGRGLEALRQCGDRLEDRPEGADLGLGVHGLALALGQQRLPVDEPFEVQAHSRTEVVGHEISGEMGTGW
jgi:hypothetical protein